MFDDSIEFRFVTRTRFHEYTVFYDGGRNTLSNREGFRPLRQNAYIREGRPCAALFERAGKIYVLASSLFRNKVDERGREIAFSFCKIFQKNNYRQRARAMFIKLIEHWEEIEDWLGKNLHDINEGSSSEGIELNEDAFCRLLLTDYKMDPHAQFETIKESVSIQDFKDYYCWPEDGYIFKYDRHEDVDFVDCLQIGEEEDITRVPEIREDSSPRTRLKKLVIGGLGTAAVATGAFLGINLSGSKEPSPPPPTKNQNIVKNLAEDVKERFIGLINSLDISLMDERKKHNLLEGIKQYIEEIKIKIKQDDL